jgi:hypothetical protein
LFFGAIDKKDAFPKSNRSQQEIPSELLTGLPWGGKPKLDVGLWPTVTVLCHVQDILYTCQPVVRQKKRDPQESGEGLFGFGIHKH